MSAAVGRPWSAPRGAPSALVGAALTALLLGIQVAADPATGVTFSMSPFTDEGWSVLGARNQALLGRWATDEWLLFWVQLPFNLVMVAVFELVGVGIIQARLVSIGCSVVAVGLLAALVARRFGEVGGLVAGIGMATSALFLYYGRLALLEPMVTLFLVAGFVLVQSAWRRSSALAVGAGICLALAAATKPSAAAAAAGILVGVAITGWRGVPSVGRRVLVTAGTFGAIVAALAIVVVAQPGVVDSVLRIWPDATPPSSLGNAAARVASYVVDSDGALGWTAPLVVGAIVGVALGAGSWRSLSGEQRAIVGGAIGWLVVGMGVLLLSDYRPNRYVVPMVPPMATLTGCGAALIARAIGSRLAATARRVASVALVVVVGTLLAFRGIGTLGAWTSVATYRLPEIQEEVYRTVSDGHALQGAVTMAMRVPVPTLVVQDDVNAGDLYRSHGVRWLLTNRQMTPTWAAAHPDAWSAREVLKCYPWPSGEACFIRVP